jgi:LysR family transcriptional activator of nhaA
MEWLNYHHLLYFWMVVREGGVGKAAEKLRLAQPTISGQLRTLEASLGEKLFTRSGRTLALTDVGRIVYRYADEIFTLGRELRETVKGRPTGRPARLVVGIADVLPKLVVHRLLQPALQTGEPVRLVCYEDKPERLFAELALHNLDLVLTDAPMPPSVRVRAFNHLLGETPVGIFGHAKIVARVRRGFPKSLERAPMALPTENTALRRNLDEWFDARGIRPEVAGEFEDSALLKAFSEARGWLFPAPSAIAGEMRQQHHVVMAGRLHDVRARFYAVSVERKLTHPAVVAISEAARRKLFG